MIKTNEMININIHSLGKQKLYFLVVYIVFFENDKFDFWVNISSNGLFSFLYCFYYNIIIFRIYIYIYILSKYFIIKLKITKT
jgi:hypothetical protein